MDHHCVFINKCIGFYNYKFFLLFLIWASITCCLEAKLIFDTILSESVYFTIRMYELGTLDIFEACFQVSLIFFVSLCLSFALFFFFIMHLYLAAMNTTTLEFCEKRRTPGYVNHYYISVFQNLMQVFGHWKECVIWPLPLLPSSSKQKNAGIVFPHQRIN